MMWKSNSRFKNFDSAVTIQANKKYVNPKIKPMIFHAKLKRCQ